MSSIFISYRRADAPGHAGRLYDRLVDHFGEASVFKDMDSMEPGADFAKVIESTVARCDALIAVIGRDWLGADGGPTRRLEAPEDWVHLEIGIALKRNVRVIPLLVEGAQMPSAADLPPDLQALTRRHAIEMSESAWRSQVTWLIEALEKVHRAKLPDEPQPAAGSLSELRLGHDRERQHVQSRLENRHQESDYASWPGRAVVDVRGRPVGRVREVYVDEATDIPAWLLVRCHKGGSRFAPVAGTDPKGDTLRLDYSVFDVEQAPELRVRSELASSDEEVLREHYAACRGS